MEVHIDVMCPFAYQTSRWLRNVRDELGIEIDWRAFSLEEVNRAEGKKHPWERPWSYGWSLLRIMMWLRRSDADASDRFYERCGRALHVEARKPHEPEVCRELMGEVGIDPAELDRAIADPTTNDEVRADHQRVLAAGGFGVPTLFLADQCLFGPVLVDPPAGAAAVRLWRAVEAWAEFPHLYELQRPKSVADHAVILDSLQPYLRGRDWKSVNRGEVIELNPHPS
ncbi:MAG: DsbA family protein [Actinobacteria bacterium]|nr:DsbA family protein [Actinomycetota bacterium]